MTNNNTKDKCKMATQLLGGIAKKVFESATHAAVFAFVSKKVTDFLERAEDKKEKVRVEEHTTTTTTPTNNQG